MSDQRATPTLRLAPDAAGIARAAEWLRTGRLVAFPTETVYGLGADATNGQAVAGIYAAKGRPSFNPLIAHLPGAEAVAAFAHLDGVAARLAQAFWPGPLTLVLPLRDGAGLSPLVTAGLQTVGLRVPEAPLARQLLAETGRPVAAPSANPSGRVSPTTADHVLAGLGGRIDAVLDGGPCGVGLESTILGFDRGRAVLLRPGGLPAEALAEALGYLPEPPAANAEITAPGMLRSHYAPKGRVRLNADSAGEGELLLGFGAVEAEWNLSPTGDLREAAARLFELLQRLDAEGAERIAVSPVPDHGLGRAINDRLRRAAAPRGEG